MIFKLVWHCIALKRFIGGNQWHTHGIADHLCLALILCGRREYSFFSNTYFQYKSIWQHIKVNNVYLCLVQFFKYIENSTHTHVSSTHSTTCLISVGYLKALAMLCEEIAWLFLGQLLTTICCIQAWAGSGRSTDREKFYKVFTDLSEGT